MPHRCHIDATSKRHRSTSMPHRSTSMPHRSTSMQHRSTSMPHRCDIDPHPCHIEHHRCHIYTFIFPLIFCPPAPLRALFGTVFFFFTFVLFNSPFPFHSRFGPPWALLDPLWSCFLITSFFFHSIFPFFFLFILGPTSIHIDATSMPHRCDIDPHRRHIDARSMPHRCHIDARSMAHRCQINRHRFHIDATSMRLRSTSMPHRSTSKPHRCHIDATSMPHRCHIDATPIHIDASSSHFDATSIPSFSTSFFALLSPLEDPLWSCFNCTLPLLHLIVLFPAFHFGPSIDPHRWHLDPLWCLIEPHRCHIDATSMPHRCQIDATSMPHRATSMPHRYLPLPFNFLTSWAPLGSPLLSCFPFCVPLRCFALLCRLALLRVALRCLRLFVGPDVDQTFSVGQL